CPTISGKTVEVRDQVRIIRFSLVAFIASILLISRSSTNGPFLLDRLISGPSRGGGRERSACRIPCACGACACRASARPRGAPDGGRPSTCPRRRRAGGRRDSSPSRAPWGAHPSSGYDPPYRR